MMHKDRSAEKASIGFFLFGFRLLQNSTNARPAKLPDINQGK
jgi:hypothetical protein